MPSLQSWEQALLSSDLNFNSSVILSRNYHYPVDISTLLSPNPNQTNASLSGMAEMTIAAEEHYPVPPKDPN
jgi:beta-mannosidase